MLKIGLTGGIGSGKSVVARVFKILEVPVYHADSEAKRIMNTHSDVKNGIRNLLGDQTYRDGKLDRAFVASRVFNNSDLLNKLNEIVHKFLHQPYIIEEAAILFETGFYKDFDYMLVVYASEELRIRRVMERDLADREEILKRMSNQMSEESKKELADFTIFNNENDLIIPQVLSLHHKFLSLQ